jgi:hypothetical protein
VDWLLVIPFMLITSDVTTTTIAAEKCNHLLLSPILLSKEEKVITVG